MRTRKTRNVTPLKLQLKAISEGLGGIERELILKRQKEEQKAYIEVTLLGSQLKVTEAIDELNQVLNKEKKTELREKCDQAVSGWNETIRDLPSSQFLTAMSRHEIRLKIKQVLDSFERVFPKAVLE